MKLFSRIVGTAVLLRDHLLVTTPAAAQKLSDSRLMKLLIVVSREAIRTGDPRRYRMLLMEWGRRNSKAEDLKKYGEYSEYV